MNLLPLLKTSLLSLLAVSVSGKTAKERHQELLQVTSRTMDTPDQAACTIGSHAMQIDSYTSLINALVRAEKAADLDLCVDSKDPQENTFVRCQDSNNFHNEACKPLLDVLSHSPKKTTEEGRFFSQALYRAGCLTNHNDNTVDVLKAAALCR